MKLAVLFSGGKDSTFTLYYCLKQKLDVKCLITLKSSNKDSYMFHTPNINITEQQSKALNIPLLEQTTSGEKELELEVLKKAIIAAKNRYSIDTIAVGAVLSNYQSERVNKICKELQLACYSPLWHKNQELLLTEIVDSGFEIIIQSIAADGLNKKWIGRKIDKQAIAELVQLQKKFGLNPTGEGGEYESLVLNAPIFKKRIVIEKSSIIMENECTGKLIIEKIRLEDK